MAPRHGKDEEPGLIERLRAQLAQVTAERDKLQQHLEARAELDQMLMADSMPVTSDGTGPLPAVSPQRARSRHGARPTHLKLVPGFVLVALAGLKWAWHAHRVAMIAASALTVATATSAGVVVAPHGPIAQAFGATPVASAPASGLYSAAPIGGPSSPASLRLIGSVSRPEVPGLDAKSASGSRAPAGPPPALPSCCYYAPPSSQPQQQQSSGSQSSQAPAAGPATLTVPISGLDLSSGTPQQVTLTATGSGWVSWKVDTAGSDLDFSPTHGVLQAGQSATLTISVDPAQAQDGNLTQVFEVGGQQVTVTLPGPPPAAPSPVDTAAPAPTTLPS